MKARRTGFEMGVTEIGADLGGVTANVGMDALADQQHPLNAAMSGGWAAAAGVTRHAFGAVADQQHRLNTALAAGVTKVGMAAAAGVTCDSLGIIPAANDYFKARHAAVGRVGAAVAEVVKAPAEVGAAVADQQRHLNAAMNVGVAAATARIADHQRVIKAALGPTADQQRRLNAALGALEHYQRPLAATYKTIAKITDVSAIALARTPRIDLGVALDQAAGRVGRPLYAAYDVVAKVTEVTANALGLLSTSIFDSPRIRQIVRYFSFLRDIEAAGWLPYYTIAPDYLDDCGQDPEVIDARIDSFYKNHWASIRNDIESRMDQYHISDETKTTFREALEAHGSGLYRCVIRVLFPEIEKEFAAKIPKDKTGSEQQRAREILHRAGACYPRVPRKAHGRALYSRVSEHIYRRVDASNRAEFERDDVPNRHASLHGLVHYRTHKHSMNMIVMTDYIFQVLTAMADDLGVSEREEA